MTKSKKREINIKGWMTRISAAEKQLKNKHREVAKRAERHYYNDENNKIELPIYWSSVQVQRSALYAKPPNPEIRGRNSDANNTEAKHISKILEEAITYQIDQSDFHADAKRAVLDYLVTDLGVVRIKMDVDVQDVPVITELGVPLTTEEGEIVLAPEIKHQSVYLDHWPWERFIYDIGKDWEECDWVCYTHHMTPAVIYEEYGRDVKDHNKETGSDKKGTVKVYEVWDKRHKSVYEFIEGDSKEPLRVRKDPLGLKDFFDCPKPMISNMRSAKYIPQSDFGQIERQLEIINNLEMRIDKLTQNIKDRGFYDKSIKELASLQTAADGTLIPVDGLRALLDGGTNFENVIAKLPILKQAQCVEILQKQKEEAKNQIYEITGLSDIVRGATKASETATAQQIKGQWASVRLQDKQSTIASWMRQIMRMFGEVVAEHFTAEQLTMMTGIEIDAQIMQTMQDDMLRCYAIDIETDSTIQADESQERTDRMEMINNVLPLLQNIIPAINQGVMPMDMGKGILLSAVRGFKYTRGLEDMIEGLGDNMQQLQQLQQQLQEQGMQAQQMQQQYEQQMGQMQQVIQDLQGQLEQFNAQEQQRENIETQAEAEKDMAEAEKKRAEAEKIRFEQIIPPDVGNPPLLY